MAGGCLLHDAPDRIADPRLQIVVEKLTKNVNENHLYEIFGQFGVVKDLDLPMNRRTPLHSHPLQTPAS